MKKDKREQLDEFEKQIPRCKYCLRKMEKLDADPMGIKWRWACLQCQVMGEVQNEPG